MSKSKDEIRAELERMTQVYQGESTLYAAQPLPSRMPWKKRPSLLDRAFSDELEKIKRDQPKDGD